jgi:hypothetical protein
VRTEEGAVAMMRYVLEAYGYAFSLNDAARLTAVSADGCTFCEKVEQAVANNASGGYRVEGGGLDLSRAYALSIGDDGYFSGRGDVAQHSSRTIDATGNVVETTPERALEVHVALRWTEGRWSVLEVGTRPASRS